MTRRTETPWRPGALSYWQRTGAQLGQEIPPIPPPAGMSVASRALRIPSKTVLQVEASDLNVVLQRLTPSPQFDLIVATNILVYYDTFEQSLALASIEKMLRPGGFLLSNNSLLLLPSSGMR